MQRFHDATTTWFTQGENAETLARTPEVLTPRAPSKRPQLILGAVGVGLIVFGVSWAALHPAELPAAQVAQPVAVPAPAPTPAIASTAAAPEPAPVVAAAPPAAEPVIADTKPTAPQKPLSKKAAALEQRRLARLAAASDSPATIEVLAGESLLKRGQYSAALGQFQKLLIRQPSNTRALRGAYTALDRLGRKNDAARVCRHALSIDPSDLATRSALASIYYSGGAYQWSANEWRAVLAARPGDPQALRGLRRARSRL